MVAGSNNTTWLSEEAYERLQAELEELKTEGRREVSQEIRVARSHGDLRENAEFDAAKEKQGRMEARIRQLESLLRDARIGEAEDVGEVAPGLVVTLRIDGQEETYLVGSREDHHDSHEILSADSPIGRAVLGRAVDESVEVEAPVGSFTVTVTGISTP